MMEAGAIIRFGGIEAYGDRFRGAGWHFTDLIGLTDSPAVVRERIRRAQASGTYRTPAYLDERVVRVPGFLVAADHGDLEDEAEQFRGLITQDLVLSIETPRGSTWVRGTVTEASFTNHGFAPEGTWSLELICEDPRRYGKVRPFAGGVRAINRGNFPAIPVHLITGTSGPYTINGPGGKKFMVSSGPGSGTDRVDMATGRVYRNGTLLLGVTFQADLWTIPPGLPGVTHTVTAGSLITRVPPTFV